jgi:hypothetical protein
MKKSTSESSSPKPRTKVVADSSAEPATKPPAPKSRKVVKKADTPAKPSPSAPALRSPILAGTAPTLTVVAARVDIGFGNHLFLRGTGPGLNWDVGTPMVNAGSDLWTIDLHGATGPICCKFLINDELWSMGPDYIIDPGAQLEVTPLF